MKKFKQYSEKIDFKELLNKYHVEEDTYKFVVLV